MVTQVLFYLFSGVALGSALGVVLLRNVVHAALLLGLCLTMVGGLFALTGADFVFAAQILIYVGAIAILFLFVVLLAGRRAEFADKAFNESAPIGAILAFLMFAILGGAALQVREVLGRNVAAPFDQPTTNSIGTAILGPHAVGMEIAGLILLAALVGVTLLARGFAQVQTNSAAAIEGSASRDGAGAEKIAEEAEREMSAP